MTRTMIIPDIHNEWVNAEIDISNENPDKVVFLGDYFDSYEKLGDVETAEATAFWLKESLSKPERTHLIGNHDLSYITYGALQCSGYNTFKDRAIKRHMTKDDWRKLKWYHWVDDTWLCTHAGLSKDFYLVYNDRITTPLPVRTFLEKEAEIAWNMIDADCSDDSIFWYCSPARGGIDAYSGILWCDWHEFKPLPPIKQIFGHTHGDFVRQQGNNYCLDTGGKNWAIYDDVTKTMTIKGEDKK